MEIIQQFTVGSFVLIGLGNVIRMAIDGQWKSFALAMTIIIVSTIFGYLKWYGLTSTQIGLALGVGSSGVYKGLQVLGVKPTGQPNI